MKIEDLIETDWFDAFVAEHTTSPRQEIVRTIRRYCFNTGKRHEDVWRSVYARLVRETGLNLILLRAFDESFGGSDSSNFGHEYDVYPRLDA